MFVNEEDGGHEKEVEFNIYYVEETAKSVCNTEPEEAHVFLSSNFTLTDEYDNVNCAIHFAFFYYHLFINFPSCY